VKLREHQAKDVFARYGIPVPQGEVVTTVDEAVQAAEQLGGAVVLKPQLGVKGRGKVGGIGFAADAQEAGVEAARLLGAEVRGETVVTLLVEQRADILRELYLAVTVDYATRRPVLMASTAGGVEIERVADADPEALLRIPCSILTEPSAAMLAPVAEKLGADAADLLALLYRIFRDHEAEMVEINPVVETPTGLLAVDAVLNVNESALFRHSELQELADRIPAADPLAEEARRRKWTYIDLEGDIGILSSGAGLTMTILDMITRRGGTAANFLDTAQIDAEGIYDAFALLHRARPPKVWLVNIFAGLNRCDMLAEGLLAFLRDHPLAQPLVVRMVGSLEDAGHRLLRDAGIEPVHEIEDAVERCLAVTRGGAA